MAAKKKKKKKKEKEKEAKPLQAEKVADDIPADTGRLVFEAAAKSEEYFDHLQAHYRECKRKDTDIDAKIAIILDGGERVAEGTAKVSNVSPSGALLTDVALEGTGVPTAAFTLELKMTSGGYEGIQFQCKPVRLVPEKKGMGVKFEEIFVSL
jgi:hypothetical protein